MTSPHPALAHPEESTGLVGRLLAGVVGWSAARPTRTIVLAGLLATVSLLLAATSLKFKTTRTDLVDPNVPTQRDWQRYVAEFGDEQDIIVAMEGGDRATLIAALETVAQRVRAQPALFEKLCHRLNVDRLKAKGLLQLDLADLRRVRLQLDAFMPLLAGGWGLMNTENTLRATLFRLQTTPDQADLDDAGRLLLVGTAGVLESTARFLEDRTYVTPAAAGGSLRPGMNPDDVPEYFFSRDGRLAFLRVAPKRDPSSFMGYERSVNAIHEILKDVRRGFPHLEVGATGLPVLEHDEMRASQNNSGVSMLVTVIGVTLICILGFRSIINPLWMVLTIAVSACWTIGFATLAIGHLNILSSAFLVTLIGLGIDFCIVWLGRHESLRRLGIDPVSAGRRTAGYVGPGMLTGALTTALAFLTTRATGFVGLMELGVIAGGGIMLALAASITLLPALLALSGRLNSPADPRTLALAAARAEEPAFPRLARHPRINLALGLAAAALLAPYAPRFRVDYNLLKLQQEDLPSVVWEHRLLERTGTSGWYAVALADSAEQALELKRKFRALDSVGEVIELAGVIPADQEVKLPIVATVARDLRNLPRPESVPVPVEPRPAPIAGLLAEMEGLRDPANVSTRIVFGRLRTVARRLRLALEKLPQAERATRLATFERRWLKDLVGQLHQLKGSALAEPVTVADLPTQLAPRYVSPGGKWLVQIFAKEPVWDREPLERFVNELKTVDPRVTGKPVATLFALTQMMDGYRTSALLALGIVALAVLLDFRHLGDALLALVPVVICFTAMFGCMALFGIDLNPANAIALPLLLGMSVDYGVHSVHEGRSLGRSYRLTRRLAHTMLLSATTTIVGFASLWTAPHWGLRSIGLVLILGLTACLVSVLWILPALQQIVRGRAIRSQPARVAREELVEVERRAAA
jgi:hypothetical protein